MTDYRATPEQWTLLEKWVPESEDAACILELRARVETLEAAAHKHIVETSANILALASQVEALEANSKPTPNPSQIRSSLVELVMTAIERADGDDEARAAILGVAAWLDTMGQHGCSLWLREEAER